MKTFIVALSLSLILSTFYSQIVIANDSCLQWSTDGTVCLLCNTQNLYYQNGNSCSRCSDVYCIAIDASGKCTNCQQGYYLAGGKFCTVVQMIPGCINYNQSSLVTVCTQCSSSTILVGNKCLKKVANCQTYIFGVNLCQLCNPGYTQSADWTACVPGGISFCLTYDCNGLCVQCSSEFPRLSSSRNLCLPTINNCWIYQGNNNACKTCLNNYTLTSDAKACLPNIFNCATYVTGTTFASTNVLCATCVTGYYVSVDQLTCVPSIPNCANIDQVNQICLQCASGYRITDDLKACLIIIPYCYQFETSNMATVAFKCRACMTGYLLSADLLS